MDAALGRVWAAYERDGKLPNLVALGKELSVPVTTLRRYVKLGYRSIEEVPPSHRPSLLTEEQERKVAVWICIMSACGKSVTRKEIDSHIYDMLTLEGTPPKRIQRSADWWQGFDARWPSLGLRRGSKLERARAINTNEYQIGRLFDELERALAVVKPRSLWNCDESGFSAWSAEGGRLVYGFRGSKETYVTSSNDREHMTCVCTIGVSTESSAMQQAFALPLFFIFKGSMLRTEVLTGCNPRSKVAFSPKGWVDKALFSGYLDWFAQQTKEEEA